MQKEIPAILRNLESQGCLLRRTKAGYLVLFPDGTTSYTIHVSNHSDHRAVANIRAFIRRQGLEP